jgi:hypothetical protein
MPAGRLTEALLELRTKRRIKHTFNRISNTGQQDFAPEKRR